MLDIVMVAHAPNYKLMAHRAVPATGSSTDTVIRGSLPSAVDQVPMHGKVILSLEGGRHQDFESAEAYLASQNLPWQIVHSDETSSYYQALMRSLEQCASKLVAIVPPWCAIRDEKWVQRMIWPLQRDPAALLCTTWEEQGPAKDLAVHVAKPRVWPGGEIILARRAELHGLLRLVDPSNFYPNLAKAVGLNSWRLFAHPGIRFERLPHDDHDAARAESSRAV